MNLEKLPKWAQDHIADLQRERDTAVRTLREFEDAQTKSDMWHTERACIGEERGPSEVTRYLQTNTVAFRLPDGHECELSLYQSNQIPKGFAALRSNEGQLEIRPWSANMLVFRGVK